SGYTPTPGDGFLLIKNDVKDAVSNRFNNLPTEGSTILVGGVTLTASYAGGDGNDVILYDPVPVTIDQAVTQADPSNAATVHFTVVFSVPVIDFSNSGVTLGGTANPTTALVTGGGTIYDVAVSGMTQDGTVTASLAAGVAHALSGAANAASTSTD